MNGYGTECVQSFIRDIDRLRGEIVYGLGGVVF